MIVGDAFFKSAQWQVRGGKERTHSLSHNLLLTLIPTDDDGTLFLPSSSSSTSLSGLRLRHSLLDWLGVFGAHYLFSSATMSHSCLHLPSPFQSQPFHSHSDDSPLWLERLLSTQTGPIAVTSTGASNDRTQTRSGDALSTLAVG